MVKQIVMRNVLGSLFLEFQGAVLASLSCQMGVDTAHTYVCFMGVAVGAVSSVMF